MLSWLRRSKPRAEAVPAAPATPPRTDPDELMRMAFPMHQAGDAAGAQRLYREILRVAPGYADAHYLLGRIEHENGRHQEALPHLQLAVKYNDREAAFHRTFGEAVYALGRWQDAIGCFRKALELDPSNYELWCDLGCAYEKTGQVEEAARHFEKALEMSPDSPEALNNVAMSRKDRGRVADALPAFHRAQELRSDQAFILSNYLYALNFSATHTAAEIFREHLVFDERFGTGRFGTVTPRASRPDPGRRLRIGYFSPDLRAHPVPVFLEPVLAHHDRRRVEVFCYHLYPREDTVSQRLKALCDRWIACSELSDTALAERMKQDDLDLLVDLAGHTGDNRLQVLGDKPASVIATWLGYPNTTGLRTVDYRLTDGICDPPGQADRCHTETLLRLPGAQWCFTRPDVDAVVTALPAAGRGGRVRFGSFNNSSKLTDGIVAHWAVILRQVDGASLQVWGVGEEQRARIRRIVQEHGVDPARLSFTGRTPFHEQLALYQDVDIALDTFPYSGVTTTFNSLWMGVPVLSLAGDTSASRSTLSILSALGLQDWSATTPQGYVATAMRKAADLEALARLRAELRDRIEASALMDGPAFVHRLESTYRDMWRARCAGVVPA